MLGWVESRCRNPKITPLHARATVFMLDTLGFLTSPCYSSSTFSPRVRFFEHMALTTKYLALMNIRVEGPDVTHVAQ